MAIAFPDRSTHHNEGAGKKNSCHSFSLWSPGLPENLVQYTLNFLSTHWPWSSMNQDETVGLEFILHIAVSFPLSRAFTFKKLLQDARMAVFLIVTHAPTFSRHNVFGIHPAHHCLFPSELSTHIQKASATCKGWLSLINTNVPTFSSHNVSFRSEDKPPVSYSDSVSNDKPTINHAIFTFAPTRVQFSQTLVFYRHKSHHFQPWLHLQ